MPQSRAPALSFDTYLQDNVKYKVIINNLYGSEIRIRGINKDFIGMDVTSVFRPENDEFDQYKKQVGYSLFKDYIL